jgi:CRISPR-associated protein Cas2
MMVLIVERVFPSLRGQLTRWLVQAQVGVFVGRVSARVRDLLWQRVCRSVKDGVAILIHQADTEQGFLIQTCGKTSKSIEDFEGILLAKSRFPA